MNELLFASGSEPQSAAKEYNPAGFHLSSTH